MALVNYSTKQPITLSASDIDKTESNIPITLTHFGVSSEIFTAMASDGSDIRFSEDLAGTIELPRQIEYVDKASEHLIVHVKVPSVTASTAKVIYIWAGNPNVSEPAPRAVSGSQNTWQNCFVTDVSYYGTCHFQDSPTSGILFPSDTGFKAGTESTGNWTAVNNDGGITQGIGTGPLPNKNTWILDNSDNITNLEAINTQSSDGTEAFYLEFWCKTATYPNSNTAIFVGDFNRYLKWDSSGKIKFGDSGNASTNGIVLNQWNQVILSRDVGGTVKFGLNGVANGTTSTTQSLENMNRMFQDRNNSGTSYSGMELCWIRLFRGSFPDINHIGIQYNAINNHTTFATAGTPVVVPASSSLSITVLDQDTNPIEDASVYIDEDNLPPYIMNDLTDSNGEVSTNYSGPNVSANLRVRKYGYKQFRTPLTINGNDINQTVTMITDPQQV